MLLSLVWAGFDVVHGTILGLLLRNLSVTQYIIWSRVIGWPLTGALVGISAIVIYREALRHRARCDPFKQFPLLAPTTGSIRR